MCVYRQSVYWGDLITFPLAYGMVRMKGLGFVETTAIKIDRFCWMLLNIK